VHTVKLAAIALQIRVGIHLAPLLPGKIERSNNHPAHHRYRQIGKHGNHGHRDNHQHIVERHFVQYSQRGPGKGLLRHHKHHPHQRRQRNAFNKWRQEQHKQQNHHTGGHAGQSPAPAGAEVNHGLADHRAPAHAAECPRHHIRRPQRHALAVRVATAFGDFVGEVEGQQGFQQTHHCHHDRIGRNDAQGLKGPGNLRQAEAGQTTGDMRHVTQGAGWQTQQVHRQPYAQNGHQRRWRGAGQTRQQIDDGHGHGHQPDHHVQRHTAEPGVAILEVIQLRHGNHDCQAVDEAQHHRVRHHAYQLAEFEQAERQHDQPAQQHRSQQILHTVLHHQGNDHHRHRPGSTGHHARPAAKQRG